MIRWACENQLMRRSWGGKASWQAQWWPGPGQGQLLGGEKDEAARADKEIEPAGSGEGLAVVGGNWRKMKRCSEDGDGIIAAERCEWT